MDIATQPENERPLIQIGDLIRPMNEEEYAEWQNMPEPVLLAGNETGV